MNNPKRPLAMALALVMLAGALSPAASAAGLPTSCDESYYATLDYYGALTEASVVKSYRLNGNTTVTDHGVYDQVINLTDSRQPQVDGDQVYFDFSGDAPEKFYFEGKTAQPFEDLPWTISVSYRHNGAPALAEALGGKSGLFEIDLDVLPNPKASEYARNNLVLTAAAVFNDDDILSLEAPGAQVQMVGNLRAVLFAVLPGEEQHFAIRVGSEDFSFSGLVLLAVPATLQQLDQVAELKEAKDKGEDSYHAISDSLDVILNSLEGMTGSMNAAANGLDRLNGARQNVSNGKDQVYAKTDVALGDLDSLADRLGSLDRYSTTASQAVTDLKGTLDQLNGSAQALRPELEKTQATIQAIQKDTKALSELLTDVEGYNKKATNIADSLARNLDDLEGETEDLQLRLYLLEGALKNTKGISTIKNSDLLGMLSPEEAAQMKQVLELRSSYENYLAANKLTEDQLSFQTFIISAARQEAYGQAHQLAYRQYCQALTAAGVSQEALPSLEEFLAQRDTDATIGGILTNAEAQADAKVNAEAPAKAQAADAAYQEFSAKMPMVDTINSKIRETNRLITGLTGPTGDLVGSLADLCETVGDTGMTDDLASLAALARDLLKTMKEHEGEGSSLLSNTDELGSIADRTAAVAHTALGQLDSLNGILDTYEPDVQAALTDVQTLSGSLQSTLHDTSSALSSAEGLLRSSGSELDGGMGDSLRGLADVLRKATVGLSQTDTIRDAKSTVNSLIEDEWNSHAGEDNNLLLMDASAPVQSMTSSKNDSPASIQYVMRTQEIKAEEPDAAPAQEQAKVDTGTFWGRIKAMFRDLWNAITGIFRKD